MPLSKRGRRILMCFRGMKKVSPEAPSIVGGEERGSGSATSQAAPAPISAKFWICPCLSELVLEITHCDYILFRVLKTSLQTPSLTSAWLERKLIPNVLLIISSW